MLQIAPHRYQSAQGALKQLGENLEPMGERALVVASKTALERFEDVIRASLKDSMIGLSLEVNLGPSCLPEIERLVEEIAEEQADMVMGVGGGQTLDVAKYAAHLAGVPTITVPTVSSSSAAFTNMVHIYNEEGEFIQKEQLPTCADLTVLDYKVAGLAPSRFLVAGMGLAYSSSFELSLSRKDLELSQPRQIAFELARHIRQTLQDKGERALSDVKRGEVTSTVESILEINIMETGLVSGLGGHQFRSMLAHQLAHQLIPYAGDDVLFGELVAFGVIVQEQLREVSHEEMRDLFEFYLEVGLPLSMDTLGLPEVQRKTILEDACRIVHDSLRDERLPFEFELEDLLVAVEKSDEVGQSVTQSGLSALT